VVERRAAHLVEYQGERLARRYRARVEAARAIDPELATAVAKGYHKLLTYKDEYEVARLHDATLRAAVDAQFTGVRRMRFHLAPPLLGGHGPDGRPRKRSFGPWMLGAFGLLRRFRFLRGTPFDPFGYTADRRLERRLIVEYERDMDAAQAAFAPATRDVAVELAALPLEIRGFGPVKAASAAAAAARREALKAALAAGGWPKMQAAE
jgi:indolepyruvate ferredoxin oxidoreductase